VDEIVNPTCDVSVVIPCHNAEAWIAETVASVVAQSKVDFEIVLVDDGSSDRSVERAQKAGGPRLRILRQPQSGVSRARNAGTAAARGRCIQYLDADDVLLPMTLRLQLDAMAASGCDVAYCDWIRFEAQPDGSFRDGEVVRRTLGARPDIDIFSGAWWPLGALLYSRRIVERILPWREDLPIVQDARFCLDAALAGATFAKVDHVGVRYRSHPRSLSQRSRQAFVEDWYRNTTDVESRWLNEDALDGERRQSLARVYWSLARSFFAIDRTRFAEVVDRLRKLDPENAALEPRPIRVLSRVVGYPAAEHAAQYWRGLKTLYKP
jgi:glycosyltransferase involved in cell wall biosynthesis